MLNWSFKINILNVGWLWKLKGLSKMPAFQGRRKTQLTTENWKIFSQRRLSICDMKITAFPFFFLFFISLFWPKPISNNVFT